MLEVARRPVLVAASHGTSDTAGQSAIAALVEAVRAAHPELTVADSFVDVQQPDVPTVLGALDDGSPVILVPLLLSAGYHVHVDLAEHAAVRPGITVTGALGPDPRLAEVLAQRLTEAGFRAGDRVVLAAAGSSNASAVADCHLMGRMLADTLDAEVTVSFISAAFPRVPDAVAAVQRDHPDDRVLVSTYLLAPGYFSTLATRTSADATSAPLLREGEPPPPELVAVVADLYASALR
nr:CbiX/SirB N-terminal domain-containing protein [Subtercola boreus]